LPDRDDQSKLLTSLEVKAVDPEQRTIEGYAATFGNLDLNGDVIDKKAFVKTLSEKTPSDIAVFVGHNSSMLPVGIPVEMRTDDRGLWTKTRIFKTQAGDDLLQTARELQAAGQPLGMSIGFQTRDSKWQTKDGKTYRLLTDADLMEYSYAAKQVIASPPALVTAVKTRTKGAGMSDHEHFATGETPVWSTAFIQGLPDEAFAYIEDGGEQMEGKTIPHALRHFPHHNEDGSVNVEAVKRELDRATDSPFREFALGHLRQHAQAEGVMGDGAKIATSALSEISATLADLSLDSSEAARALSTGTKLGFDGQKVGVRLKGTMRAKLKNIKAALDELLTWAESDESTLNEAMTPDGKTRGGTARRALERARFAQAIAWDGKTSAGELSLDNLHGGINHLLMAMDLLGAGEKARKKWDPDDDGDDDSTPEGDTDHDHWDKDGNPIPGTKRPPSGKAKKDLPPWLKPENGDDDDDDDSKVSDVNGDDRDDPQRKEEKDRASAIDFLAQAMTEFVGHHDAVHPEHDTKMFEQKAEWDSGYVSDLPDSAFAMVYTNDAGQKVRKLPHHKSDGSLDMPHLRNALSRAPQMKGDPQSQEDKAIAHLNRHASAEGVGEDNEGKTRKRRNGKPTGANGYVAALKDMELTLAKYQSVEP